MPRFFLASKVALLWPGWGGSSSASSAFCSWPLGAGISAGARGEWVCAWVSTAPRRARQKAPGSPGASADNRLHYFFGASFWAGAAPFSAAGAAAGLGAHHLSAAIICGDA